MRATFQIAKVTVRAAAVLAAGALVFAAAGSARAADYFDPPGKHFELKPEDMPKPGATRSVMNFIDRAKPTAIPELHLPAGFKAAIFADGFKNPRNIVIAPNGDIFLAESGAGEIVVLRDADGDGKPEVRETFASGLELPFGIAFSAGHLYAALMGKVLKYSYEPGQTKAKGEPQVIVPNLPTGGQNNHKTRNLLMKPDGAKLFISIGSAANVAEEPEWRATILECNPDGSAIRIFGSGLRNPVGLAWNEKTGELWTSVNERDQLGDDLVPDYITSVKDGGFYGYPYYYIGKNYDERLKGKGKETAEKVIVPDVLIGSHSAALGIAFYGGKMFPEEYRGDLFAALHGSWNRSQRTGYKVIRVRMKDGKPAGGYENFMTGFLPSPQAAAVLGRPVGVAVAADGALLVTDDHGDRIWRVTFGG